MPLDPQGSSTRDLGQGPALTPKSGGVWRQGDTLPSTTLNTELTLALSSLPRYVYGVSPCPYFLGQRYDLEGAGRGIKDVAGKGKHIEGSLGTHGGS